MFRREERRTQIAIESLAGPFGEAPRDRLLRESFLLGFVVLLSLVLGVGVISYLRLKRVETEIVVQSGAAQVQQRIVLSLAKETARLGAEVRTFQLARDFGALTFPARNRIAQIEKEIDATLASGRNSPMATWPEWIEVERSYGAYKTELERAVAAPGVETTPEGLTAGFEQAVDTALARVARESEGAERAAAKLRRDGQRDIVLATTVCLAVGLFVSVVSFVETRRRIALLGHAYRRLAQNKEVIESTLEGMSNAVVTFDLEGKVTGINAQALAVFGLDETSDAIDRPAEEALARQPRILAILAPIIVEASAEHRYLGRIQGKGGRLFDVSSAPLEIGGEVRGFVVSLADVTEAERAASELRRNRALMAIGQMTAQVAHEIKNPLGGVRLSAQVLERMHAGDARSLEIVRRIQSSVDLLSRIVAELNQFARPRELDLAHVNVGQLLDDLLQNVGDRVVEKRIEVVRDVDDEIAGSFDEGELRKALINFLVNALEASPEGGTLTVAAERDEMADEVTIRIRDEGHGMDEETLRRLFEPFYTTKQTGTGLGMSIAQKIVEQHRGRLTVESAVGEGTTVAVTLPLTLAAVAKSAAKE